MAETDNNDELLNLSYILLNKLLHYYSTNLNDLNINHSKNKIDNFIEELNLSNQIDENKIELIKKLLFILLEEALNQKRRDNIDQFKDLNNDEKKLLEEIITHFNKKTIEIQKNAEAQRQKPTKQLEENGNNQQEQLNKSIQPSDNNGEIDKLRAHENAKPKFEIGNNNNLLEQKKKEAREKLNHEIQKKIEESNNKVNEIINSINKDNINKKILGSEHTSKKMTIILFTFNNESDFNNFITSDTKIDKNNNVIGIKETNTSKQSLEITIPQDKIILSKIVVGVTNKKISEDITLQDIIFGELIDSGIQQTETSASPVAAPPPEASPQTEASSQPGAPKKRKKILSNYLYSEQEEREKIEKHLKNLKKHFKKINDIENMEPFKKYFVELEKLLNSLDSIWTINEAISNIKFELNKLKSLIEEKYKSILEEHKDYQEYTIARKNFFTNLNINNVPNIDPIISKLKEIEEINFNIIENNINPFNAIINETNMFLNNLDKLNTPEEKQKAKTFIIRWTNEIKSAFHNLNNQFNKIKKLEEKYAQLLISITSISLDLQGLPEFEEKNIFKKILGIK